MERRAIGRQPLGHPLRAERPGHLPFLLAEIIVPAPQGPVESGVGVKPAPFPGRPAAQRAAEHLVPGVARAARPEGVPRPDGEERLGRNRQVHVNHPWSGRHRRVATAGSLRASPPRAMKQPGDPADRAAASLGGECTKRSRGGQGGPDRGRACIIARTRALARRCQIVLHATDRPAPGELNGVCLASGETYNEPRLERQSSSNGR